APSAANRSAIALPMPRLAPVTSATWPRQASPIVVEGSEDAIDERGPDAGLGELDVPRLEHPEPELDRPQHDHDRVHVDVGIDVLAFLDAVVAGLPLPELFGVELVELALGFGIDARRRRGLHEQRAHPAA